MDRDLAGGIGLVIVGFMGFAMLALLIWSLVWVYSDAERRGRSGCVIALLVFLVGWPLSLVLWTVARPDEAEDRDLTPPRRPAG